jgi:uncharacterized protein (DUF302 family)
MSDDGLITRESARSFVDTVERLVAAVTGRGMSVFARIDHADGAAQVSLPLRPTTLVLFGNPKGGTPLMQDRQTAGIDLPLKALVWEGSAGKVWLTLNDPAWIANRHGLGDASAGAVRAMTQALRAIADETTGG